MDPKENINVFLTKNLYSLIVGLTIKDLIRMLWRERFAVSIRYIPRVLFIIISVFGNLPARWLQKRKIKHHHTAVKIHPPVFILGHWRSGTTHLHNLLTQDDQFGYPNFVHCTQPNAFMICEDLLKKSRLIQGMFPKTRVIDNMASSMGAPMEDELALCIMSGISPHMGNIFPASRNRYAPYLTMQDIPEKELTTWKDTLKQFVRTMSININKPLILKSPTHTCRIRHILDVFPDARFIHIHRNPFDVFRSYRRVEKLFEQIMTLQVSPEEDFDTRIIAQYQSMYDRFLEDRQLIPQANFCEISFEQLDNQPIQCLESIYAQLSLGPFSEAKPAVDNYLKSISGFRKSALPPMEVRLKKRIYRAWRRFFEAWGYAADTDCAYNLRHN